MEQLFHKLTIIQTMRKNANMVLRCLERLTVVQALSLMVLTFGSGRQKTTTSPSQSTPRAVTASPILTASFLSRWGQNFDPFAKLSQVTVSNNNPEGWSTGVVSLTVLVICSMALAILGNLTGLVSKNKFWGSVQAGEIASF